jgi:hypothetical protein
MPSKDAYRPVEVKLINGRNRVVFQNTRTIAKTSLGNPRDGGGWPNSPKGHATGMRQVGYINTGISRVTERGI